MRTKPNKQEKQYPSGLDHSRDEEEEAGRRERVNEETQEFPCLTFRPATAYMGQSGDGEGSPPGPPLSRRE